MFKKEGNQSKERIKNVGNIHPKHIRSIRAKGASSSKERENCIKIERGGNLLTQENPTPKGRKNPEGSFPRLVQERI